MSSGLQYDTLPGAMSSLRVSVFLTGYFLAMDTMSAADGPNYNRPMDRPFTLREPELFIMEREFGRQIRDGDMQGTFPRPCRSVTDTSGGCNIPHGFQWSDRERSASLRLSPQGGYQFRHSYEAVNAFELGALATGSRGPISAYLDARTYTELHEDPDHASFDREFVDRQSERTSGTLSYSSYSRYRANLNYDATWGRFSAGRESPHWGPGLYGNLVFHRFAVPFNQSSFTTRIGPLELTTLYGRLTVSPYREFLAEAESRSLYAHRYEWRIGANILLGVSEQLILNGHEEPFAFIPIIPLFIFKSDGYEHLNNGNLAVDFAWRPADWGRVYGEFLLDDLQSPTSLFDDQWGNKWGALAGVQLSRWLKWYEAGAILEASRVEPWVYTHYHPGTTQSANHGYPLGNPAGPNSQVIIMKTYLDFPGRLTVAAGSELSWKGKDLGSQIDDIRPGNISKKEFLDGIGSPDTHFSVQGAVYWKGVSVGFEIKTGAHSEVGISVAYRL